MRLRKKKESVIASLEQLLKDNHCEYTIRQEENHSTIISFEFQAAHFIASVRQQDDCVEITYPTMATAPVSQLELVRAKCNERNYGNMLFKYTYTVDHEKGQVQVHMSFFNNRIDADQIIHELKAAFHCATMTKRWP